MKRLYSPLLALGLGLGLGVGLGFGTGALSAQSPEAFGERVDVNVVNVEVYVTDRDGKPVSGLQRKDFEVLEDGKPMEIVNFDAFSVQAVPGAADPAAPAVSGQSASGTEAPAAATSTPDGQHLAIFIDNVFLRPAHRSRALTQIRSFLSEALGPEDKVMVVTQDPGLHVRLPFTADRAALAAALTSIESLPSPGLQMDNDRKRALDLLMSIREVNSAGPAGSPCDPDIAIPAHTYAEETRQEVLRSIGTLTLVVNSLAGIPGRKALLHVSDGLPLTPGEELFEVLSTLCGGGGGTTGLVDAYDAEANGDVGAYKGSQAPLDALKYSTTNEFNALAAHANAQRVTFYPLQASGVQGSASADSSFGPNERLLQIPSVAFIQSTNLRSSLTLLASETGGRAIFDANVLGPELARIQQDFGTYYSLGYAPKHFGDSQQHRIEVKVKRPQTKVRHRQAYRDKPVMERTVDRTLTSLFYGTEDNPLEIGVELGDPTPAAEGQFKVPVRLRIPLFKVSFRDQSAEIVARLRLIVATGGMGGEASRVRQVEVPVRISRDKALVAMGKYYEYEVMMTLPAGEQKVAISVRDEGSGLTSYLVRTVDAGGAVVPAR